MTIRQRRLLYPMALSLLLVCAASGRADVQLSGTEDHVVLRANNATIAEILSGIRSTLNVRVGLTGTTGRQITGAYAGSLRRVLSRVLDGENYVISSAADDGINILILGPKVAGRSAAPVAPATPANAKKPVEVTAGGDDKSNLVQGWVPIGNPLARLPSPLAAAAKPAQRADARQPVKLAAGGDEENNPVQGWTGSVSMFDGASPTAKPAAPAQPNSANPATPQTANGGGPQQTDEGNPNVQGWVPTASVPNDVAAKAAPAAGNAPARAAVIEDEGNPNFQGYMPGWTPPEPGKSVLDALPFPRAAIGAPGQ